MKKSIKDLGDVQGKRALVRVDINVPLDADKNVTDDTRIQAILPTVKFLQDKGAKIILMAHLGRPKGEWNLEFSLEPVAKYLAKVLGEDVLFVKSPVGEGADKELAEELDKAHYQFSSANSINIGRLVPQIVYYVYAYSIILTEYKNK